MEKTMCQDVDLTHRQMVLADNCDAIEMLDFMRKLSKDQIDDERLTLSEESVKLAKYQAELDKLKKEYKDKMTPVKNKITETIQMISQGQESVSEKCYKFVDGSQVGYYDKFGNLVKERPATADERSQKTTFQVRRGDEDLTGTHD